MTIGKFYGVGIGPGDPRYMTLRAVDVLRAADVIFTVTSPNAAYSVSRAVVGVLGDRRGELRELEFSMAGRVDVRDARIADNAARILEALRAGNDCAFATLGDAMTYSTFGHVLCILRAALPDLEVEVVPGITAFAALAARTGTVLAEGRESLHVIPAFRPEMAATLRFEPGSTTVLLKTYRSRAALLDRLAGERDIDIVYGECLGLAEEFVTADPDAVRARKEKYLSLIMVRKHG